MFEYDGNQVSINDFFKDKYNYKLKYPHLPCIIEKDRQKMSLYPQEVLEIERGQRVSCQKSSRSMAENMIKECRMNPLELKEYIERAIKECLLDRDNKFLKNFKVCKLFMSLPCCKFRSKSKTDGNVLPLLRCSHQSLSTSRTLSSPRATVQ